ncbi:hypothetical protein V6N12_000415 [Hibiscus sabdariffa]|uniref:Uncharacterized protein n=1 Tax=Hibiscus sabdariffa TaxID=183260 RepID=A0ABR2BJW8_9ROSI
MATCCEQKVSPKHGFIKQHREERIESGTQTDGTTSADPIFTLQKVILSLLLSSLWPRPHTLKKRVPMLSQLQPRFLHNSAAFVPFTNVI